MTIIPFFLMVNILATQEKYVKENESDIHNLTLMGEVWGVLCE